MIEYVLTQAEYLLRILLAGICGGIIGYERTNRGKGAGIRTHIIVAIASLLMMIVSKYGFSDMAFNADFRLDPSRVASQIVSGVGFLGAGMIFIQKQSVRGLTTAAGIWAVSGIGMAIGSGMYTIGILTSMVVLVVQVVLHKNLKFIQMPNDEKISFVIENSDESVDYLKSYLSNVNIHITGISFQELSDSMLEVSVNTILPQDFDLSLLLSSYRNYIKSVSI